MTLYTTRKKEGFQVKDVASMEIGDVFGFELKDGEAVRAMAVKKDEEDGEESSHTMEGEC